MKMTEEWTVVHIKILKKVDNIIQLVQFLISVYFFPHTGKSIVKMIKTHTEMCKLTLDWTRESNWTYPLMWELK